LASAASCVEGQLPPTGGSEFKNSIIV